MQKPKISSVVVGLVLGFALTLCMATSFTYTLDCASPVGTDSPSSLDDKQREGRYGFQERLNVDHLFALTGTQLSDEDTGMHRQVTFYSTTSTDPVLGVTAVDGVDELRYTNSDSTSFYLTSAGTLNIGSSDLLGTLANNAYFTAVDNAGTGTVDLIKADANDVAVVPDNSQTATSAAPTSSTGIVNKKYVDDNATMVPAATGAGTGYAGGESVTLPNGFIIKGGVIADGGNTPATTDITFGTAFPNAILSVVTQMAHNVQTADLPSVHTVSVNGFKIIDNNTGTNYYWMATGY